MGSLIPESEALEFESAAHGESHTWRATREFALLGEILGSFEWGALDLLMFDLPPGAERTVQYADFLRPRTSFLLVTIPFRGVTGRRRALGRRAVEGAQSPPRLRREHERLLLPRLRRHQAAVSSERAPRPGDPLPGDRPVRSRAGAALRSRGIPLTALRARHAGGRALEQIAERLLDSLRRPPLSALRELRLAKEPRP
jgi:hypothetical protein